MYISLSELQNKIKRAIEFSVKTQWVLCEISELRVNANGHCYLELIEKHEGKGAIPKAKASAIIWRSTFPMLNNYFVKETGQNLSSGIKVMLLVEVNYHELYGVSLVIKDLDPSYTLGESERMRRETLAKLTNDGVIDMNRELELPIVIERVAVISSATAAGFGDFTNHLKANPYGYSFTTELFAATVQGEGAENSIIAALMLIAQEMDSFDAVVLIRGGGSQSDLSCFDSYVLCSYLAQFPLPILTGIGHDRDNSVADRVAHTPLKTPTAVANFIIDTKHSLDIKLSELGAALSNALAYHMERESKKTDNLLSSLRLATINISNKERLNIEKQTAKLQHLSQSVISKEQHKLEMLNTQLNSNNPQRILDMGYSLATLNGQVVRDASKVKSGDKLQVRLQKGVIDTTVN